MRQVESRPPAARRPLLRGETRTFHDKKPRSTRITLCGRPPWSDEPESPGLGISHVSHLDVLLIWFPVLLPPF